jgi:hypothetical protein
MLESGRCVKKVLDPYDWLPGYGENSVNIWIEGLELTVFVAYDGENDVQQEKEIKFKNVSSFYKGCFPGPGILGISYNNTEDPENFIISGCLVEFPESRAAQILNKHFNNIRSIKHYKMVFLSENVSLEVFAEEVVCQGVSTLSRG